MSSPVNQRIKTYWTKLVVHRPSWWKSFFSGYGRFGNIWSMWTCLDCIRFCFISILRKEHTGIANEGNPNLLLPNRNNTPFGRPGIIHFLPHIYVTTDRMISNNPRKTDRLNLATFAAVFYQIAKLNTPKIKNNFLITKFDFCGMQNIFNEKQQF